MSGENLSCPYCGGSNSAPAELLGRKVLCRSCGGKYRMPASADGQTTGLEPPEPRASRIKPARKKSAASVLIALVAAAAIGGVAYMALNKPPPAKPKPVAHRSPAPEIAKEPVQEPPPPVKVEAPVVKAPPVVPKEEPRPVVEKPAPPPVSPKPAPARDIVAEFERRASDPVAALRWLSEQSGREPVLPAARRVLGRTLDLHLREGLKAFAARDAAGAEKHLTGAALLAEPYAPDLSTQLMRMWTQLKAPRTIKIDCGACVGAGVSECEALVAAPCGRCSGEGALNCVLCEGRGTVPHHSFRGAIQIVISTTFKITIGGRKGAYDPQTITWRMQDCGGKGRFHTDTTASRKGQSKVFTGASDQTCREYWDELKMYVLSGKAKLRVHNEKGQFVSYSTEAARRLFADYEHCSGGQVPCDGCSGGRKTPCTLCRGLATVPAACPACVGKGFKPCATCRGVGDASWLRRLLPSAPTLAETLSADVRLLGPWLDDRARRETRAAQLTAQLKAAREGLDPTAKLLPGTLNVACTRCKGKEDECPDCWGTGRREFFEGNSLFERHRLAAGLAKRAADEKKESAAGPKLEPIADVEPELASGAAPAPKPAPPPPPVPERKPAPTATGGAAEWIAKADTLYAAGVEHLKSVGAAGGDDAAWIKGSRAALEALREARDLYTRAQEQLDEQAVEWPKDLSAKYRRTLEALTTARKNAP